MSDVAADRSREQDARAARSRERRTVKWLLRYRVPLLFVAIAAFTLSCLIATRTDVSVWQDFRRDVLLRDAYRLDEIADVRFSDTSPYSIWLPSDLHVWSCIRSGTLPFWDRRQAGGYSPILNAQNGVMHPVRWMVALVPRDSVPSALIVLELLLLAAGMFFLLRDGLGATEGAALLGALVMAFSGDALSVILFSGAMLPLVHVPWLVWAYLRWVDSRCGTFAAAFMLMVALLLLAGHPLLIVAAIIVVLVVVTWDCAARRSAREYLLVVLMSLTGAAMTSYATLPVLLNLKATWTYKLESWHGLPYKAFSGADFWEALTWIVQYHRDATDLIDGGTIAYFVGIGTTVLALAGIVSVMRSRRTGYVLALVAAGILVAVPPPFMDFARSTPLRFFKPWYLMFVPAFGLAIAASIGFDRLLSRLPASWRVVCGLALFVVALAPLAAPVRRVLVPMPMREAKSGPLEFLRSDPEAFRITGFHGQTHAPNAAAATGIEDLRFSSPLIPIRYRQWFSVADPIAVRKSFPTTILPTSAANPLFGSFNVKYVLLSRGPVHDVHTWLTRGRERPLERFFLEGPLSDPTHPLVAQTASVSIYRNDNDYHPRAHFARSVSIVTSGSGEAAEELQRLGSDLGDTEVVESAAAIGASTISAWMAPSPADHLSLAYPSDREVVIDTGSTMPRLLVLHDSYDPGWRATIDGRYVDVMPVSLISRGVAVPAGNHRVRMRFTPVGMTGGAVLSLVAAALAWIIAARKWDRSNEAVS